MKKNSVRFVGIIIGIAAVVALLGPYIVRWVYDLIFPGMTTGIRVAISIVFVLANGLALKWGNKWWKIMAFIGSIFVVSMFIYEIVIGWMDALTGMVGLKFASIALFVICVVFEIISYRMDYGNKRERAE